MIYLGEKKVGTMYLGGKKLSKIYLGEKLVWEGYPEGHIIGTGFWANKEETTHIINGRNIRNEFLMKSDADKKFDFDFTGPDYNGRLDFQPLLFQSTDFFATVTSMNVTLVQPNSYTNVSGLFWASDHITYADINRAKIVLYSGNELGTVGDNYMFNDCPRLETIKAGNFPWGKIGLLHECFRDIPNLQLLDLSGADLSHIPSDGFEYCFDNIGVVGAVVKLTGCNYATKSAVLNALKENDGINYDHTWTLSGDTITRTS